MWQSHSYCLPRLMQPTIWWSCAQTPPSHKEKSLVTIQRFLGCTKSAVSILDKKMNSVHCPSAQVNQWNRAYIMQACKINFCSNQYCWLCTTKKLLNSHQTLILLKRWISAWDSPAAGCVNLVNNTCVTITWLNITTIGASSGDLSTIVLDDF